MRVAMLLGIVLGMAACRKNDVDAPTDAYRTFAAAESQGQAAVAWGLLSVGTQQQLTDQARAIAKARGLPAPDDGRELAFGDGLQFARDIKSVAVAERSGDRATVAVTDDHDATQSIHLVREGSAWHIDLTAELRLATVR